MHVLRPNELKNFGRRREWQVFILLMGRVPSIGHGKIHIGKYTIDPAVHTCGEFPTLAFER